MLNGLFGSQNSFGTIFADDDDDDVLAEAADQTKATATTIQYII